MFGKVILSLNFTVTFCSIALRYVTFKYFRINLTKVLVYFRFMVYNISTEGKIMKLLYIKASGFKNIQDDCILDFTAKSKKTTEDKEYELQESVVFIGNY